MSKSLSIAKEFLRRSYGLGKHNPMTSLQLQQFLYIAQGWSLILRERELFPEDLDMRPSGPAVGDVFRRSFGDKDIVPASAFDDAADALADESEFVKAVWEAYNDPSVVPAASPHQNGVSHSNSIAIEELEDFFDKLPVPEPLQSYRRMRLEREAKAAASLAARPPLDIDRLRAASKYPKTQTA